MGKGRLSERQVGGASCSWAALLLPHHLLSSLTAVAETLNPNTSCEVPTSILPFSDWEMELSRRNHLPKVSELVIELVSESRAVLLQSLSLTPALHRQAGSEAGVRLASLWLGFQIRR